MLALQNAKFNMGATVKVACDANTLAWTGFPPFAAVYTDFTDTLTEANVKLALQSTMSQGATETKDVLKGSLQEQSLQVSSSLVLYGAINGLPLKRDAGLSKTAVKRLTEKALIGYATKLGDLAAGITTPPLTTVSLTAGMLTNLQNATTAFTTAMGSPRYRRAEARRGTEELAVLIDKMMGLLDQMDKAVEVLKYSNPEFYSEYTTAREIIDPGFNTRRLTVKVKASGTAQSIAGAVAVINPGNITKKSGPRGMFYITNLPAGTYTMMLTDKSFQSKTKEFNIAANQATVVEVEMLPNP